MHPHTLYVVAFILLTAGTVSAIRDKAYTVALVAAGLAFWVAPAAFQLSGN